MRNRYPLFCFALVLGLPFAAQAQQPFERLGVKVKILSLSNGRYPEYFPNDSLRRIGSIVYDTKLRRIAYLLPPDSLTGRVKSEVTSRWIAVDPLAGKFAHISPYVFVSNNPIRFKDPDGRAEQDVILRGSKANDVKQQLQSAVQGSLVLSMKNGKLSYTQVQGATLSKEATQLKTAIDDHTVNVNVYASADKLNSAGKQNPAGSFFGNTVTKDAKGVNQVETRQEVNGPGLAAIDAYTGKPGAGALHEVTESYIGGKISQQTGISSMPGSQEIGGSFPSFYQQAHNAASPQYGTINESVVDQNGQPFEYNPGQTATQVNYSIQEGNRPAQVFMTYP